MHPWKKIIQGKTQVEETTTCFMCLMRVPKTKFKKHMSKFHAASCQMDKLDEMCREAEERQATEALNFDEIIEEEKYGMGTAWEMFRKKQESEQGHISYKCFLCQGNWTGTNKEDLKEHLEDAHKVVFKIEELVELSAEELEPIAITVTQYTNSGEHMGQYFILNKSIIIS